jgi:hypothetical protein
MKKLVNKIFSDKVFLLFLFFYIFAVFLRFYRLNELAMFLGDQGRDAIIAMRIITLQKLTLIGPSTSVGMIFLGPFYYYFIAPWLLLFNFNPAGLAHGVAFFSSIYILVNYFTVKEMIGRKTAFISSILISFSSLMVEYSRFSWNPNLMPLFALLTTYFLYKALETENKWYFALSGAFLSICIQLHYLALFLIPAWGVYFFVKCHCKRNEAKLKKMSKTQDLGMINDWGRMLVDLFISIFSFLIVISPLFIFDLRHDFVNTKTFLKLFEVGSSQPVTTIDAGSFYNAFHYLNNYIFNVNFEKWFINLLLIIFVALFVYSWKYKKEIMPTFLFFIFTIIGLGLYSGAKNMHYFVAVYPYYFILIGYLFAVLSKNVIGKIITAIFLGYFIFSMYPKYMFLHEKGYSQIAFAKRVANKIAENVHTSKIQISTLPGEYSESTYRYFVLLAGVKVMERDSLEKVGELFVICEHECKPIGNPQWDIAYFAPNKVEGIWQVDGVKIYKLIH